MRTLTIALTAATLVAAGAPAFAQNSSAYSRATMAARDQPYPSIARFDACHDLAVQRGDLRLESRHEYDAFMAQCEAGEIR